MPAEPLIIDELALPEPGADQVAVKLLSSGICHSQLHGMANATARRPILLGHEGTGVVIQTGAEVSHVKEGDHVIVTWVPRAARPAPTAGTGPSVAVEYRGEPVHYSNVHTWSEHVVTPAEHVVGIAQDAPTDVSCIVGCAVLTGAGAIPPAEMTLDPRKFMFYQRRYRGSHGASIPERDFPMYLRLHAEGRFPLDELVTDRYRLDQINEACAALRAGDIMGRAIIEYD